MLFVMKTLEDERQGVITAYKLRSCFGDFEKFVCMYMYCMSVLSLHIESTDSMIVPTMCTYLPILEVALFTQ